MWNIPIYECDPSKNTLCTKTHCYLNGGDCHQTLNIDFRRDKSMLKEIMDKQLELQTRLGTDFANLNEEERAKFMRDHRGYMEDEIAEALYEMPNYKMWKDYSNMDEEARNIAWAKVRMELIDALHFFVNLLLCAGMTAEEVHYMYMAKNKENHRRQDAGYTADVSYREQAVEEVLNNG